MGWWDETETRRLFVETSTGFIPEGLQCPGEISFHLVPAHVVHVWQQRTWQGNPYVGLDEKGLE